MHNHTQNNKGIRKARSRKGKTCPENTQQERGGDLTDLKTVPSEKI